MCLISCERRRLGYRRKRWKEGLVECGHCLDYRKKKDTMKCRTCGKLICKEGCDGLCPNCLY